MAAVGQPQQALNMGPSPVPAGITREQIQQTYMVSALSPWHFVFKTGHVILLSALSYMRWED